jgi:phage-related minor tail protein
LADGAIVIETKLDDKEAEKGISSLKDKMKSVSDTASKVGGNMTKYVTAPLVAAGAGALAAANEIDQAMKTIRAGTGATGEKLEALTENFKNVFANVPEDAATVSSALADLNTRTGLTGKPLEDLTTKFLDLSRITGEDVSQSITSITRLFGDWGIESENSADAMDYLWNVSQTTGIGVDQLSQKLVQFGAPLRQIGFSMEESAALMGKWEKEGVNMELVMGGLRVALGKMAKAGKEPQKEFPKIIEQIQKAGSAGEANAIALEHFGARAGADMAAAIREGRFSIDELMETLGGSSETIGKAAADTETLGDKFNKLKNNTMVALEPIGKILLDFAMNALPPLIEKVQKVAEWFGNLDPVFQQTIVIVGAVAAAIGPFLVALSSIISAVGTILPVLSKLGPVFTVIRTAIAALTGPIGIVIAIVTTLAIVIYKNWDSIKTYTVEAFNSIGEYLKAFWEATKFVFSATFEYLKNLFFTTWEAVKTGTIAAYEGIKNALSAFWQGVTAAFNTALNFLKNLVQTSWNAVKTVTTTILTALKNTISTIWNGVKTATTSVLNALKNTISSIWNSLKSTTVSILNSLKSSIQNIWNGLKNSVSSIVTSLKNTVVSKFQSFVSAVGEKMTAVKSKITQIWDQIRGFFKGINLVQIGKDIIQGLINGIISKVGAVTSAIRDVTGAITGKIKSILNIHSPSRWMRDMIGKNMMLGWQIGIEGEKPNMLKQADEMTEWVTPKVPDFSNLVPSVASFTKDIFKMPKKLTPEPQPAQPGGDPLQGGLFAFDISIPLDGEVIAKKTIKYTSRELYGLQRSKNRGGGRK